MKIFAYVDVQSRSLDLLKRINSRGYDLYLRKEKYRRLFEVHLKSETICSKIKAFQEQETFSREINRYLKAQFQSNRALLDFLLIQDNQ